MTNPFAMDARASRVREIIQASAGVLTLQQEEVFGWREFAVDRT